MEYSVLDWQINGILIWPILRIRIYLTATNFYENLKPEGKAPKPNPVNRFVRSIISGTRFFVVHKKQVDYIFLEADSHRVNYKNQNIDRFFDFFIDEQEKAGKNSMMINYNNVHLSTKPYKGRRFIAYEPLLDLMKFIFKVKRVFKRRVHSFHLKGYNKFYEDELLTLEKQYGMRFNLGISDLNGLFELIAIETKLDNLIIKRLKPVYVFSLCYYSLRVMIFNQNAAKKGIATIELQHGPQTGHHAAYMRWTKVPKSGFQTMPKYFWCWEGDSVREINQWAVNTDYHLAFNGGHPWIEYFKGEQHAADPMEKPRILVTLQPTENVLPEFLVETIRISYVAYDWWIRLHPRQMSQQREIKKVLKNQGVLDLVNFNDATQQPLPLVLRDSIIHITQYSGATIEAALLGIKTVVVDRLGESLFQKQIDEGKVTVLLEKDASQLLDLIAKEKPGRTRKHRPKNNFSDYCGKTIAQVNELEKQSKKPYV